MKQKDDILLEQAYESIFAKNTEAVQEKYGIKSTLAGAAALGLTSLGAAGYEQSQADSKPSGHTSVEHSTTEENPANAFDLAVEKIHAGKSIPTSALKSIVKDKDLSFRLAYVLALKNQPIPSVLKSVVGDYDKKLQSSLIGP